MTATMLREAPAEAGNAATTTVLPARPSPSAAAPQRRVVGRTSREQLLPLVGAGVSALILWLSRSQLDYR